MISGGYVIHSEIYYETLYRALKQKLEDPDYEWADVSEAIEAVTGVPVSRDTIRRGSPVALEMIEAGWVRPPSPPSEPVMENPAAAQSGAAYAQIAFDARKELIKLRDERTELARIQREMARKESMLDLIKRVMQEEIDPLPVPGMDDFETSDDAAMIIHLTDVHYGLDINNWCNAYNDEILAERLAEYLCHIRNTAALHKTAECHLMLGGDMISGLIHSTLRAENNMDVLTQLKRVSEHIANFVSNLSSIFEIVHVYSVPGNHSRLNPKKEDNIRGENLDLLIPWYLSARLNDHGNVMVHEENIMNGVALFFVKGNRVCGVHGDKDTPEQVVQKMTMFLGAKPDVVIMGHRHTNALHTAYDSRVIESGCVSGPDEFCMEHRLRNKPEQSLIIMDEDGVKCIYPIVFTK